MKDYKVGQRIVVRLADERIVEAEVMAIFQTVDGGLRLNIAFGNEAEAATIYEWQIVKHK